MNMNREAVNAALGLAGNQPLLDDDKKYNNSVYVLCKGLYLPSLFTSLTDLDWKCARKYMPLRETQDIMYKMSGVYYYDIPADCIKPLSVDDNTTNFRIDGDCIITERPANQLYYVFHNRNTLYHFTNFDGKLDRNRPYIIKAPLDAIGVHGALEKVTPNALADNDDDFPEWEYTHYDNDFWDYFTYRFAAKLIPRLRADDAAGRVQAMEAIAEQKSAKAVLRERESETNIRVRRPTWSEQLGLRATYEGGGYGNRRI